MKPWQWQQISVAIFDALGFEIYIIYIEFLENGERIV